MRPRRLNSQPDISLRASLSWACYHDFRTPPEIINQNMDAHQSTHSGKTMKIQSVWRLVSSRSSES
jgi:hypothetical protein